MKSYRSKTDCLITLLVYLKMYKHSNNELTPAGDNRFAALSEDFVPMTREQIAKHLGVIQKTIKQNDKAKNEKKKKN